MGEIKADALRRQLKSGEVDRCYLLYGKEHYLQEHYGLELRKAVTYAINRQAMVETAARGFGTVMGTFLGDDAKYAARNGESPNTVRHRLKRAEKKLKEIFEKCPF